MSVEEFDDHVRVVDGALSDLADLLAEWPFLDVPDRATARYEWSEALSRLWRLTVAVAGGHLSGERADTVLRLQQRLAQQLPLAESIGLDDPRARTLARTVAPAP